MILKKSWSTSKGSNWQLELAYDGRLPDSLFVYYCTRGRGSGSKMTAQPKLLNLKMVRTCLSMMEWNSIKKVAVWHSPSLPLCVGCTPILLQSSFFCILWRQYIHMHLLCLLRIVILGVILFIFFNPLSSFFVSILIWSSSREDTILLFTTYLLLLLPFNPLIHHYLILLFPKEKDPANYQRHVAC